MTSQDRHRRQSEAKCKEICHTIKTDFYSTRPGALWTDVEPRPLYCDDTTSSNPGSQEEKKRNVRTHKGLQVERRVVIPALLFL